MAGEGAEGAEEGEAEHALRWDMSGEGVDGHRWGVVADDHPPWEVEGGLARAATGPRWGMLRAPANPVGPRQEVAFIHREGASPTSPALRRSPADREESPIDHRYPCLAMSGQQPVHHYPAVATGPTWATLTVLRHFQAHRIDQVSEAIVRALALTVRAWETLTGQQLCLGIWIGRAVSAAIALEPVATARSSAAVGLVIAQGLGIAPALATVRELGMATLTLGTAISTSVAAITLVIAPTGTGRIGTTPVGVGEEAITGQGIGTITASMITTAGTTALGGVIGGAVGMLPSLGLAPAGDWVR